MNGIYLDGDFPSGVGSCRFHCFPTCHPLQVDEDDWKYGCTHKIWPQNRYGDFVPIVNCGGDPKKCELPQRQASYYRRGLTMRINNARKKIEGWDKARDEADALVPPPFSWKRE